MCEIKYTYEKISGNTEEYDLDGYSGSCGLNGWELGEGIFLEKCVCHPERRGRLIAVLKNGEKYDLFTIVSRISEEV